MKKPLPGERGDPNADGHHNRCALLNLCYRFQSQPSPHFCARDAAFGFLPCARLFDQGQELGMGAESHGFPICIFNGHQRGKGFPINCKNDRLLAHGLCIFGKESSRLYDFQGLYSSITFER